MTNSLFGPIYREGGRVVFVLHVLHFLAVFWLDVRVRLVLRLFWHGVVDLDERLLDVLEHGEVDLFCILILIKADPHVAFASPIMQDGVEFMQHTHEFYTIVYGWSGK